MLGSGGYISLYRSLMDKSFAHHPDYLSVWIFCLLKANYADKTILWNGMEITIKRGQFITGRRSLSKETGVEQHKVDRILKCFESAHQIEQQKTNKYRLITILNYNDFQNVEPQNGQQTGHRRATTEPQVGTTNKENKENKSNPEPRHLELATFLESKIKENLPFVKFKDDGHLESWSDDFRKMEELDNIPFVKMKEVLAWSQQDSFWKINIRSAGTFRKQFGQLEGKARVKGASLETLEQRAVRETSEIRERRRLEAEAQEKRNV